MIVCHYYYGLVKCITIISQQNFSVFTSAFCFVKDFKEELETVVTDLLRSDKAGNHVFANAIANVISPFGQAGYAGKC